MAQLAPNTDSLFMRPVKVRIYRFDAGQFINQADHVNWERLYHAAAETLQRFELLKDDLEDLKSTPAGSLKTAAPFITLMRLHLFKWQYLSIITRSRADLPRYRQAFLDLVCTH